MKRFVLLALALVALAGGCQPNIHEELVALQKAHAVYRSATEPSRDFDADGDGEPDDPAQTRASVARLESEIERLIGEMVEVTK